MRNWLSQLTGSIDDRKHPLGTEGGIAEFQQMLPVSQPAVAIREVCETLEQARAAGVAAPAFQRALATLDEAVQPALHELRHMLFRDARGEKISDVSQRALVDYATRMAPLYAAALAALKPAPGENQEGVALLALRAMRQLMELKKFARVGYQAPPQTLWSEIHRVHALASRLGVLRLQAPAYPGEADRFSTHNEYVCGLLLETAPLGSLLPTQIECLDLLLHRHAASHAFSDSPSAQAPFCFDLERPGSPQRWLPGLAKRPSTRYIGAGGAAELQGLAEKARGAGEVPTWAVPSECDLEGFVSLLLVLRDHWSPTPPQRRHRRSAAAAEVLLVHGLVQARRMVAASELARTGIAPTPSVQDKSRSNRQFDKIRFGSVNPDKTTTGKLLKQAFLPPKQLLEKMETAGDKQLMQRSSVADTSDSGIGVSIPGHATWARLGVLVGYRFPDTPEWQLAIVRRIAKVSGQLSVGLERLMGRVSTVHFLPEQNLAAARSSFGEQVALEALLLENDRTLLIAPTGEFRAGQSIVVGVKENARPMRVASLLGSGRDYRIISLQPA
ncbi:MAG TPA: hypothetical protein VHL85_08960 [Burkholderiales bacterium]|nr:hypothetical protein [Burkholderiales bacterium]